MQGDDASVKLTLIRDLTARRSHREALAAIASLEPTCATSREALYLTAVNQRCLGHNAAALSTLDQLTQQHPQFSRAYEERGHCFVALNDFPAAIESFQRGVSINAALPSSWEMLQRLHSARGDARNAAIAAEQRARLLRLPAQIVHAGSLFCDGELALAESVLHDFVRSSGRHVEALRLLGRLAHQRNALDEAELLLEETVRLAPDYRAAAADYARVLIDRQRYQEALNALASLLRLETENADFLALKATALAGTGEHQRAIELFRRVLGTTLAWPHLHLLLGHSLKATGRQQEAIESYRSAAAARAGFGDAYWSLANLKTYRFTDEEIARMRSEESKPDAPVVDRYHLCFSLGKAFEDLGDYAQSWGYYERGNALRRTQSRYQPGLTENAVRALIELCTRDFFLEREGAGAPDFAPIFIVGLPRSGSTLIEQILASHSKVDGTRELQDIERIARELGATDAHYPGALASLRAEDFRRLGERYLGDTLVYRGGKPFFIDKMPNNFLHVGLIHLILPNARIIDVRREPMACCFSNFKQLYASGQEFSYTIDHIARYYRGYLELMDHWDKVLPGRVLKVQYENVIEDFEPSVRGILEFCGLELEPACVEFYKTERAISTASSEQVRQPIFREGLTQWRRYEPWLGSLRDALGETLVSLCPQGTQSEIASRNRREKTM